MTLDTVQSNLRIIGVSSPDSTYKQEYRCEVVVHKVKTFFDRFIEGWPVQKWEIEVGVEEIKVNTMKGEVQVWKVISWRHSCFGYFPLKECKQRKRYTRRNQLVRRTGLVFQNSALLAFTAGFNEPSSPAYSFFNSMAVRISIAPLDFPKNRSFGVSIIRLRLSAKCKVGSLSSVLEESNFPSIAPRIVEVTVSGVGPFG